MHIPVDPNIRWNAARIPVQRRGRTLEDLALPHSVLEQAREFVDTFGQRYLPESTPLDQYPQERDLIGVGLTITGVSPRDVTKLGCAILTEVASLAQSGSGVSVLYAPLAEYMHAFNERHLWRDRREDMLAEENLSVFEHSLTVLLGSSLVLFDGVGQERITASGAARDELSRLLCSRYRRGLVSIAATSVPVAEIGEIYGRVLSDMLLREFTRLHITAA